ncbi:YifB family Mg chelatase-like AAA ATPase [Falsibacillus pallidus]|uniref:YifB family Mg chelatase-like AAA ATPase n=1 Tax=Falsibacillus pallidus TaxID=493781 RepID=UPI003D95DB5E
MSANVASIALKGMEGYKIQVEVRVMEGKESIVIVGLPDASVKESKDRITAALHSMNVDLTNKRVIINLSPSEEKKNGPLFDLPMALGILINTGELKRRLPLNTAFLGALSLDGTIKPCEGMLPSVLSARKLGIKTIYLPFAPHLPLLEFDDLEVVYAASLHEVIELLSGKKTLPLFPKPIALAEKEEMHMDFAQIIGHSHAKRAMEIAAAGEHHLFMTGPPGCGKSMLAESFPSILPPLTKEEQFEVISLYQLSTSSCAFSNRPPFRHPHHSASGVSIIGGGQHPKPGEISLAHRGVLFLDEMAEFTKKTLDMLRQPLESGRITISRAHSTVNYPASFLLIGAMNPCPCGYLDSNQHYCTCSPKQIIAYQNRLSGPIRDRFDINLSLSPVNFKKHLGKEEEPSEAVRNRVVQARKRQYDRYGKVVCNGRIDYQTLIRKSPISSTDLQQLHTLSSKKDWSNRTQVKIIRLARTIADLDATDNITEKHLFEAMKYHSRTGEEKGEVFMVGER